MFGYPQKKYAWCALAATVFFSVSTDEGRHLRFSSMTIKADRNSPAFAAIEDAFSIRDYVVKTPLKIKKIEVQKLKLKGTKISLNRVSDFKKVNLAGEKIEVKHFTNKFINKVQNKIRLAQVEPQWAQPKSAINLSQVSKAFSSPVVVKNLNPRLSAAEPHQRRELPSGVVLTKPVETSSPKSKVDLSLSTSDHLTVAAHYSPNLIKGRIHLEGGDIAGPEGDYAYHIERSYDGKIYEVGVFDASFDDYEMEVGARQGFLLVELRNEKGQVLAYGEKEIRASSDFETFDLKIYPSEKLFSGRVLDKEKSIRAKEEGIPQAVAAVEGVQGEVQSDQEGFFNEVVFDQGSTFLAQAQKKGMWPEVKLGLAGKPFYPRLTKKGSFELLSKNIDPFGEEIQIDSVLQGEITQSGLAQKGVRVQIFGMEYQQAVYYDQLGRPNPQLKETSSYSHFAFVNLPDGGYLVQAFKDKKLLSQKWFVVREGHVATGQLELSHKSFLLASYKSFPDSQKSTDQTLAVHEVGLDYSSDLKVGLDQEIKIHSQPELALMEIGENKNIKKHLYLDLAKAKRKTFKVVEKSWLESFLNARRSNANPAMGMVIGFVPDHQFEVVKETTAAQSQSSVIYYFDRNGDVVERGVVGGGFIITDVPQGFHNVSLKLRGSATHLNKIIAAESYALSIFE